MQVARQTDYFLAKARFIAHYHNFAFALYIIAFIKLFGFIPILS